MKPEVKVQQTEVKDKIGLRSVQNQKDSDYSQSNSASFGFKSKR